MDASATDSNRRVRTRTHGGVAGVRGRLRPLCRSNELFGSQRPIDGNGRSRLGQPEISRGVALTFYAYIGVLLGFFGFGIFALQICERHIQRFVTEADANRVYRNA